MRIARRQCATACLFTPEIRRRTGPHAVTGNWLSERYNQLNASPAETGLSKLVEVSTSAKPVTFTLRKFLKYASIAIAAFLVVGLVLPFVSVGRFGKPVQDALEAALGRSVKIGEVRCTLLSGPGFSIDDVFISEDPSMELSPVPT